MKRYTPIGLSIAASMLIAWTPANSVELDEILAVEKSANRTLAQAQSQIDTLDDQTNDLVDVYRVVIEENAVLRTYNKQVSDQIAQQKADISLIGGQIDGITQTRREVMPLIQDMITSLRNFVEKDVPFRREERLARIDALQALMDQPDVAPSERYRLVLERYQTEVDYGQKIDVYDGKELIDGVETKVLYLSVGRVAFMFQTPDGSRSFVWNNINRNWEELDSAYNSRIGQAILMAQKAVQANLVRIPVFAPEGAE
jgi:hypothetical protein